MLTLSDRPVLLEKTSMIDMPPQILGIIMAKLSKQDKIEIFNLCQNYQAGTIGLSRHYQVNPSTI